MGLADAAVRGVQPDTAPVLPPVEVPRRLDDWQRLAAEVSDSTSKVIRDWADQQLRAAQDRMRDKARALGYDLPEWLLLPLWLEPILDRTLAAQP